MRPKIRILLVDDHPLVREGIRAALKSRTNIDIIGEAATGGEAVQKAKRLSPDVVLMDITMPEMNGLEAAKILRKAAPRSKILVLTIHENREYIREMARSGVRGYVLKDTNPEELFRAIDSVYRGSAFFAHRISQFLLDELAPTGGKNRRPGTELTRREREVLTSITDGLSNKETAKRLDIAVRTVETHREHIMSKLDIHNLAELTKYALQHGLVQTNNIR